MPTRAKRACRKCGRASEGAFCDQHRPDENETNRHYLRRRRSEGPRVYDSRYWRDRVRPRILRRDPICRIGKFCEFRAPSTQVDHIVPIGQGGDESEENLQGACDACHTWKTTEEVKRRRVRQSQLNPTPDGNGGEKEKG